MVMPFHTLLFLLAGVLFGVMISIILIILKWIGWLGLGWGWMMAIAILSALVYALIVNEVFDP